VFCLDAGKGTVLWQRDLRKDGIQPNEWGFAGSPLVFGDLVILNAGATGTALDRNTGRVVWGSGTNVTGYSTPMVCNVSGHDSLLLFATKHFVAVKPQTGQELWRMPWETGYDINAPDPILYGDRIFISTYSRGCALLEVKDGQPVTVYTNKSLNNHLSPGILLGEYLYAFNGEARHTTDFRCFHLSSGEVKWASKDPAFGSLICASGKLIVLSEKGELLLVEPSPVEFKPLARAHVLDGLCWTPPALADGRLYARNARGDLVCLELRTKR
jgi:outer membrane protein assembly factor BamB